MYKKTFQFLPILGGIFVLILLISCGRTSSALKDGYYSAVTAEFDKYGWKECLSVYVSGGSIILVEYNAFNAAGFIQSWDMDLMRNMNAANGTYPNAYSRQYARQLLEHQSAEGIDAISGASYSHLIFTVLAGAVLASSRLGNNDTAVVHLDEEAMAALDKVRL